MQCFCFVHLSSSLYCAVFVVEVNFTLSLNICRGQTVSQTPLLESIFSKILIKI